MYFFVLSYINCWIMSCHPNQQLPALWTLELLPWQHHYICMMYLMHFLSCIWCTFYHAFDSLSMMYTFYKYEFFMSKSQFTFQKKCYFVILFKIRLFSDWTSIKSNCFLFYFYSTSSILMTAWCYCRWKKWKEWNNMYM